MSKKSLTLLMSLLLTVLIAACSEQMSTAPSQGSNETQISGKALASSQTATLRSILFNDRKGNDDSFWEVEIVSENGAIVKFEYNENGAVREVKGLSGPFDYQLQPDASVITYEQARTITLNSKPGMITSWKLQKDESENRREYRFFVNDSNNWE